MSVQFLVRGRQLSMNSVRIISGKEATIRLISKKPLKRPDAVIQFTGSKNVILQVDRPPSAKKSSPGIYISVTEDYWLTYDLEKEMEEYEEENSMHAYYDNAIPGGCGPIEPYCPEFTKEEIGGLECITFTVVGEDVNSEPDKFMQNLRPSTLKYKFTAYLPREGDREFKVTYTIGNSGPTEINLF